MPLPIIDNDNDEQDEAAMTIRQREIAERYKYAKERETVEAMKERYLGYLERDGEL